MVFLAEKPNLREATCCMVLVVKGGAALRRLSLRLTLATCHWASVKSATIWLAWLAFAISNLSSLRPAISMRLARNGVDFAFC